MFPSLKSEDLSAMAKVSRCYLFRKNYRLACSAQLSVGYCTYKPRTDFRSRDPPDAAYSIAPQLSMMFEALRRCSKM